PDPEFSLANPLELKPALIMAAAFAVVLVVAAVAQRLLGRSGVIVTSAIAGTTDVHAATLAAATLASAGSIEPRDALLAMLIAFVVNMIVKVTVAGINGGRRLLLVVA